MRVGIVILPDQPWSEARRRWRLAEEYGFHTAWTYDHIGWRSLVDGPWFDAVPTLTAAAHVTERIRLGTYVASPNFRHPVHFAREITALDDISGGRFTLGIGAGGVAGYDTEVIGVPPLTPGQRVDRFVEFVELLDAILRTDRVDHAGGYYTAVDARGNPGCVQSPRVPFLVAGNGPRSIRFAARVGDGWITTGGGVPIHDGGTLDGWWGAVAGQVRRFEDAVTDAGRDLATLPRHLSLDASGAFSLASVEAFADAVGRAAELGFTDVAAHWPRPRDWYAGDEVVLERVAAEILPTLA